MSTVDERLQEHFAANGITYTRTWFEGVGRYIVDGQYYTPDGAAARFLGSYEDRELAQALFTVFVTLVDWCRKAGRTEVNAVRLSCNALRDIHVDEKTISLIRSRYTAGSRATAELHREGKL